jgi:hypothetical protein
MIAGSVVPPTLVIKSQGQNTQSDLFARIATNAPELDVIAAAVQADPTTVMHDPEPHHTVSSWVVLPMAEKFACLFMQGRTITDGFRLGCELLHLMPDRFMAEKGVWTRFLRSSVTRRAVGDDTSALATSWVRKDQYMSSALTNWYYALISQVTQAWLDHTGIMTKMMMGDACPLNRGLDMLRVCLRKPYLFAGWSEAEWKALVWMSHMAYQAFMHDASLAPLVQLATDLEARRRLDVRVLPEELQHRAHAVSQAVSDD